MTLLRPLYMQKTGADADISYTAQQFRQMLPALMHDEGVQTISALKVRQRAAGANFTVEIDPGIAFVKGDDVSDQGFYFIYNTAVETLTIPAPPASGTRTHRVIAQIRDKFHNGTYTTYDWVFLLQEDTGSGTPALPNSALSLATIAVAAGTGSITDSLITSTRYPYDRRELVAEAYRNSNQAIAHATRTAIQMTAESLDPWGMINTTTNPTRITVPVAGRYRISSFSRFPITSMYCETWIYKNGAEITAAPLKGQSSFSVGRMNYTTELDLAANDYVETLAYQDTGSSQNIETAAFSARYVCRSS